MKQVLNLQTRFAVLILTLICSASAAAQSNTFIRINQVGYLASDKKVAIAMSKTPVEGDFVLLNNSNKVVYRAPLKSVDATSWGGLFPYYYELDFSAYKTPGKNVLRLEKPGTTSREFSIGSYPAYQNDLLFFMRQQRCGYNPYLDMSCHMRDGRTVYAPMPDGAFIDASGGWHDAGDQLKYLITASNATARMLLSYELAKGKFPDGVDASGRAGTNGIADVLDEAKWGLDWILKLHPAPNSLFHQVADDRDHRGFKLPNQDNADYGWGPNSYRPVYFADGKPQGLREWKSKATGVANLAGRSAAAMAMAARIWKSDLKDRVLARKHLLVAVELYEMGKRQEGYQQGNSYGAPYRYNENTWADDMEWAAAELFKATRQQSYLVDSKRYAQLAGPTSWMQHETTEHYEFYPFTNIGHFALYPLVDAKTKTELANYYRDGIERVMARGRQNPYGVGVPFLWCSNNLVVAFITQVLLYEKMTGDMSYHAAMLAHRDWLLGRNPWGTSMFSGIPANGEFPEDVHLPTVQILKKLVPGGLVDGPIAAKTYNSLRGLRLNQADEFAEFQTSEVFYHDDVGDYATNEPTMDGTADAILMMALWSRVPERSLKSSATGNPLNRYTYESGAITRGDPKTKRLALVFTGDEFAEGAETIARTLKSRSVRASFFLTGRFYRRPEFQTLIRRLKREGHYLGAHSDQHLLYNDWTDRNKLLVSRELFEQDLKDNYAAMQTFGIRKADARYFLPPFEWYNQTISDWTAALNLQLINLTSGTRSAADYTTPSMQNYVGSKEILESIKQYESKDPAGLSGFILLSHIGVGPARTDKFHDHLDELLDWLKSKNYQLVRIDQLLQGFRSEGPPLNGHGREAVDNLKKNGRAPKVRQ
ncbi:MAG TPA: glycoside hydrolase family 9 protein [Pyrinomonadaceae bacterium]|nr:glycoside hydrolase family 9 protein [Pyrinomonadaceae bacterium]